MNEETNGEKPLFPMRINKYLAMQRQSSRREMDKAVELGKVLINGKIAVLGDKVNEGDKVEVRYRGHKERQEGQNMAHARLRRKRKGR